MTRSAKPVRLGLAVLALAAAQPAHAEGWALVLTPYVMAPYMDGKAAVGPLDVSVSSSPADIFRNLNWGVMGIAELNNGRFGVMADVTYMNLETSGDRLLETIGGHQGAYSLVLLARVERHAELYAGVRVNDLGLRLETTGPLGNSRGVDGNKTWVDPIVGMRVTLPLGRTSDLTVMADAGGFGVGSDVTVQAWPSVGLRLSDAARAQFGYRLIYTRYADGAGLRRFEYDVLTYGPTVGVQFRF